MEQIKANLGRLGSFTERAGMNKRYLNTRFKEKFSSFSNNDLAIVFRVQSNAFLWSKEWKELRTEALKLYGSTCKYCKSINNIQIDHILPRKYYPELALDITNLQPLCSKCNKKKGNKIMRNNNVMSNNRK